MFKFLQKLKLVYIALSVALFAVGLCLIIWPEQFATIFCYVIGSIALILGAIELVIFFVRDFTSTSSGYRLLVGLLASIFGLILLLKPDNSAVFFSMLVGVFIIIDSVVKLQATFELKNIGAIQWWVNLVLSVVSAVLGVMLVINPFGTGTLLLIFMGISLIVDAIENVFTVIFLAIAGKMNKGSEEEAIVVIDE